MENTLQDNNEKINSSPQEINFLSTNKFIFLCIISFGLYQLWWIYKTWKFFNDKDELDINPALRSIFSIFFLGGLFKKINNYSIQHGNPQTFSSTLNYIGFFVLNIFAGNLPDPYWLFSFLTILFLIQAFNSFNYGLKRDPAFKFKEESNHSTRQVVLVTLGSIFWILVLLGLSFPEA
jgi:hypothetical protein